MFAKIFVLNPKYIRELSFNAGGKMSDGWSFFQTSIFNFLHDYPKYRLFMICKHDELRYICFEFWCAYSKEWFYSHGGRQSVWRTKSPPPPLRIKTLFPNFTGRPSICYGDIKKSGTNISTYLLARDIKSLHKQQKGHL